MVSIIVPVYNVEKYLRRCVDSILAQTFTDFELILVDDGSPDNCPAICDEYAAKDSRIKVIHKQNGGVSSARNAGLDVAVGAYVMFCDSDDYWNAEYAESLIDTVSTHNTDWAVANYTLIKEDDSFVYRTERPYRIDDVRTPTQKWRYFIHGVWGNGHGWEVWSRIFDARIIRDHHIRFCTTCGSYAEDLGFVLDFLLYANRICSVDTAGYNYTVRTGSLMRNNGNTVRLDAMNELSAHFACSYYNVFTDRNDRQAYAIIHFLLLSTEYIKVVGTEYYPRIREDIMKINNQKWYKKQTRGIFKCVKRLECYFGKRVARQILLLSHYCLHNSWKRFRYESAIAYRWFIKEGL